MEMIHCDKTSCQSNNSKICCGTPCKNGLSMIDEVAKLAQEYVEEKDMEYVHAIYEAAEKLECVGQLKEAVEKWKHVR